MYEGNETEELPLNNKILLLVWPFLFNFGWLYNDIVLLFVSLLISPLFFVLFGKAYKNWIGVEVINNPIRAKHKIAAHFIFIVHQIGNALHYFLILAGILGGIGVFAYQLWNFVFYGFQWIGISVVDGLALIGSNWASKPTDLLGLWHLLDFFPLALSSVIYAISLYLYTNFSYFEVGWKQ